jgi:hypothetical protein
LTRAQPHLDKASLSEPEHLPCSRSVRWAPRRADPTWTDDGPDNAAGRRHKATASADRRSRRRYLVLTEVRKQRVQMLIFLVTPLTVIRRGWTFGRNIRLVRRFEKLTL